MFRGVSGTEGMIVTVIILPMSGELEAVPQPPRGGPPGDTVRWLVAAWLVFVLAVIPRCRLVFRAPAGPA